MKAGPRLQNITMSPKGQGLLKQNLQGHKYKKKKKTRTCTFLVTNALGDYTRMISDYFTVAISTRD
jgi:wyosine [tRNA(Phe)-imidazoG37] synthetase (radical SAM superfamily)